MTESFVEGVGAIDFSALGIGLVIPPFSVRNVNPLPPMVHRNVCQPVGFCTLMIRLLSPIAALLFLSLATVCLRAAEKPNIILILADDTGYTDIGAFAERATGVPTSEQYFETPNIDRLASEGVAFSQAYACPLCAPTRASILTGRYASKIGFTTATPPVVRSWYNQGKTPPAGYLAQDAIFWGDWIEEEQALWNGSTLLALPSGQESDEGRDEVTIAEVLNDNGYRSAFLGKWHLGGHGSKGYEPKDQGFEHLAYYDAGGSVYFDWRNEWMEDAPLHAGMPQAKLFHADLGPDSDQPYLTDELGAQASGFIESHVEENPDQPFFLYFCQFALHAPLQAKKEDVAYFNSKDSKGWNKHENATYAAMNKSMDDSVGAIIESLERTNQLENTLIVFTSDNGGVSWPLNQKTRSDDTRPTHNAPYKGGKAMVFEGGIRVPLLFYWKGKLTESQWVDRAVDCNDIFPTILELAGIGEEEAKESSVDIDSLDGQSLAGLIEGKRSSYDRDTFFWHYPFNVIVHNPVDSLPLTPHSAIRKGKYKLIFDWSGRLWLYDIESDVSETNNLAKVKPKLARKLFVELNQWLAENVEEKYYPTLNPAYDAEKDTRDYPFVDLRASILGNGNAIAQKPSTSVSHLVKVD